MSRHVMLLALIFSLTCAWASDPETALQAAALARKSLPGVTRAGRSVFEIPRQVGNCLRLPLGLTQLLFAPLPGMTVTEGLENSGRGLVAPFKLCVAVLELPYEVLCGLGDAAAGG